MKTFETKDLTAFMADDDNFDIAGFQAGKKEIFGSVFKFYVQPLIQFSPLYTQDVVTCEKIVIHAFHQLFHHRSNCVSRSSIGVFLFTIVIGRCDVGKSNARTVSTKTEILNKLQEGLPFEFTEGERDIILRLIATYPPKYPPVI